MRTKRSTKWGAEGEDTGVMKTLVRFLILSALLAASFTVGTGPAWACSCVPPNPRQMLAEFDGAFVGEFIARKGPGRPLPFVGEDTSVFTFRVTRSYKGDLGPLVDVESASDGAACGLEVTEGDQIGLFLEKEPERWTSILCLQVDARALERAAKSMGVGEAASAPEEPRTDATPSASVGGHEGSPVWPLVLIAAVAAAGAAVAISFVRARRSSAR